MQPLKRVGTFQSFESVRENSFALEAEQLPMNAEYLARFICFELDDSPAYKPGLRLILICVPRSRTIFNRPN